MTSPLNLVKSTAIALSLVALSPMAQAAGVIVFTGPASVPTLSEWGMAIMVLILAGLAYRTLRQSKFGGTPLALLVGTVIFAAGVAGDGMIARASSSNISLFGPGTYTLGDGVYKLTNASNGPLTVQSMSSNNYAEGNQCVVGGTLTAGQWCNAMLYTPQ